MGKWWRHRDGGEVGGDQGGWMILAVGGEGRSERCRAVAVAVVGSEMLVWDWHRAQPTAHALA